MMKNKQKGISLNKVTYMTHPRRGTPVVSDMLTNPKLTQGLVTTPTFVPESHCIIQIGLLPSNLSAK